MDGLRRFIRRAVGRSQDHVEQNVGVGITEWPWRVRAAVRLAEKLPLVPPCRVADYGCGKQTLRAALPADWTYVPIDYIERSSDTILCDFTRQMPPGEYDLIFCLGVLEYLIEPGQLLRHALDHGRFLVVSYHGRQEGDRGRRQREGWGSALSYDVLESLIREKGGMILEVNEQPRHERIYVCKGLHGT